MSWAISLLAVAGVIGCLLAVRSWWRGRWARNAGVPGPAPNVTGAPELQLSLGRRAYLWPVRLVVAGLVAGLVISLSTLSNAAAWDPGQVWQVIAFYGGAGLLVAAGGTAMGFVLHRRRLIVTMSAKGIALRRRKSQAFIPADAVHAVGLRWPIDDPTWTVWYDSEAAPGVNAVTTVQNAATSQAMVTLFHDRSLPRGWLEAVYAATEEILGADWRVLDDQNHEVPRPVSDALLRVDHILIDGEGRYRNERGGTLLAQTCGRLAKLRTGGASFFATNPNKARRTVVLRDPHARTVLIINRASTTFGRERIHVLDVTGQHIGRIRGRHEFSFHSGDGTPLGRAHRTADRFVLTDVRGDEAGSLRIKSSADNSRMWLTLSSASAEPLRVLALALPIAVRLTRQS